MRHLCAFALGSLVGLGCADDAGRDIAPSDDAPVVPGLIRVPFQGSAHRGTDGAFRIGPLTVVSDGVPGSGPANTVELVTDVGSIGTVANGCGGDDSYEADVTLRPFFASAVLEDVTVRINTIAPATGRDLCNGDTPPAGVGAGLGVVSYGHFEPSTPGSSATWMFRHPSATDFSFFGEVIARVALSLTSTGTHNVGNVVPDNLALASNGAVAFAKDVIPGFPGRHNISGLNNGLYGNDQSWIGNSVNSFAGVAFAGPVMVGSVAWGRDNGGDEQPELPSAQQFVDRSAGTYVLQVTTVASPDAATPDLDWTTIATITYGAFPASNSTRHLWAIEPVMATGLRLLVPSSACIDELEAFAP